MRWRLRNAAPGKSGYLLTLAVANAAYTGNNDPTAPGSSGTRHFFTDQSLVIRQNAAAKAAAGDPQFSPFRLASQLRCLAGRNNRDAKSVEPRFRALSLFQRVP